jgi:hypothetical protein
MTRIYGLGIVAAAFVLLVIGGQFHPVKLAASAPEGILEPSAEELSRSAALSFSNAAMRHLKHIYVSRWSKVLVSENAKTVCLEYEIGDNPKLTEHGVVMFVAGRASQIEADWAPNCIDKMYDLSVEIAAANQPKITN